VHSRWRVRWTGGEFGRTACVLCPLSSCFCFWGDRATTTCSQLAGSGSGVLGMIWSAEIWFEGGNFVDRLDSFAT
jgi:hypothetical protein